MLRTMGLADYTNRVLQQDARDGLRELPEASVDCVITSPPYYAQRDYGEAVESVWGGDSNCDHEWEGVRSPTLTGGTAPSGESSGNVVTQHTDNRGHIDQESDFCSRCGAWRGQLGLEPTPDLYLDHLMEVFTLVKHVLKPTGVCWVNIDDKYAGGGGIAGKPEDWEDLHDDSIYPGLGPITPDGIQRKSLMAIPERFVLRMLDAGWVYRNRAVWRKPNPMPHSATDRLNHVWEPVYMFTKQPMYWFDLDAIRDPHSQSSLQRISQNDGNPVHNHQPQGQPGSEQSLSPGQFLHPRGKNPGDVLEITVDGYARAHYAVFPDKLVVDPIKASCPPAVCATCGTPYDRKTETKYINPGNRQTNSPKYEGRSHETPEFEARREAIHTVGEWEQQCDCDTDATRPGVVLDPFGGRGTVGKVAKELPTQRSFIIYELDPESVAFAQEYIGLDVDNPEYLREGDDEQITLREWAAGR